MLEIQFIHKSRVITLHMLNKLVHINACINWAKIIKSVFEVIENWLGIKDPNSEAYYQKLSVPNFLILMNKKMICNFFMKIYYLLILILETDGWTYSDWHHI